MSTAIKSEIELKLTEFEVQKPKICTNGTLVSDLPFCENPKIAQETWKETFDDHNLGEN